MVNKLSNFFLIFYPDVRVQGFIKALPCLCHSVIGWEYLNCTVAPMCLCESFYNVFFPRPYCFACFCPCRAVQRCRRKLWRSTVHWRGDERWGRWDRRGPGQPGGARGWWTSTIPSFPFSTERCGHGCRRDGNRHCHG